MTTLIVILLVYFALLAVLTYIGYLQTKKAKDSADSFLTSGQSSSMGTVAFTMFCHAVGASAIVGVCGDTYTKGFFMFFYIFLRFLCFALVGLIPGPRVQQSVSHSAATLLGRIFGPSSRLIFGIQNGLICMILIAISVIAVGDLLVMMFGITRMMGMVISTLIFFTVTFAGGIVSTNLTNYLNTFVMLGGALLLGILAVQQGGGLTNVFQQAVAVGGEKFAIGNLSGAAPIIVIAYLITNPFASAAGGPEMLIVNSAKSPKAAKWGPVIGGALLILFSVPILLIAYVGVSQYPGSDAGTFFYSYAMEIHPIVGGLAIAGVVAASVSSAAGLGLGVMANATSVMDGIREMKGKQPLEGKQALMFSRIILLIAFAVGFYTSTLASSLVSLLVSAVSIAFCAGACWWGVLLFPKAFRKSTFNVTVIAGLVGGLAYVMIPAMQAVMQHVIFPQLICGGIAYVITLIVDKRPVDLRVMYTEEKIASWTAEERWLYLREKSVEQAEK